MKKLLLVLCLSAGTIGAFSQNNALQFDGINDIVIGSSNPLLEITNGTVELWVKPESKSSSQTFICYRNSTGSQTRYLWNFLGNLSGLGFWNGSFYLTFNYSFNSGQWYHLAFVGEAAQTKIFVNGFQVGVFAIPFGTATGSALNLVLGNDIPGNEFFSGELDEVRIWNKALCADEINNYMSCELTGNEPGLIAYFNFNQGVAGGNNQSQTTLQDASPNGITGTLNNFSLTGPTSNWVSSSNGVSGSCAPASCPLSHTIQIYYLITSDYSYVQAEYDEIIRSMDEIQGWYQAATGGKTFHMLNPNSPIVVNLPNSSTHYSSNYWGTIQTDMNMLGHIPFNSGIVNVYFIKGGGGVALGAQWCGVDCGLAMFGMDIYPQFNTGQFFTCPNAPGGAAAFPCTPLGAATHELGHCFGLPHPIDHPSTSSVANHSVMQTHWNYPYFYASPAESPWGLLTIERQTLVNNPFFFDGVDLLQGNEDLPIVNLPITGPSPTANFSYSISDKTIHLTNTSSGHSSSYWTFGDQNISHNSSPTYTFDDYGIYTVRLRVSNNSGMMSMKEEVIDISSFLPLDLIYFKASQENSEIKLQWMTENEIDFSEFEIFKSDDGRNWHSIGTVNGKGGLQNTYVFSDASDLETPVLYYRLKMIDLDASYVWSPIRTIRPQNQGEKVSIFPNPSCSNCTLSIAEIDIDNIDVVYITDFTGKHTAFLSNQIHAENRTNLKLALPQLSQGIYLLKIVMRNGTEYQEKLVIMDY